MHAHRTETWRIRRKWLTLAVFILLAVAGIYFFIPARQIADTSGDGYAEVPPELPANAPAGAPASQSANSEPESLDESPAVATQADADGPARIEGRVVNARTGKPVPVFRILAPSVNPRVARDDRVTVVRDPEGRFSITDVKPGTASMLVRANGFADTVVDFPSVSSGETRRNVNVKLAAAATLEGRVINLSSRAVRLADISVEGRLGQWLRDRSNDDGTFYLTALPPGPIKLRVSAPDLAPQIVTVNLSPRTHNETMIVMRPLVGATIEGVVTLDSEAIVGAEVLYYPKGIPSKQTRIQTDEKGRYRITILTDSQSVRASIGLNGGSLTMSAEVVTEEGKVITRDFNFLTGTGVIKGIVRYAQSDPKFPKTYAYASMPLRDGMLQQMIVETDGMGEFRFSGLPAGDVRLFAHTDPYVRKTESATLHLESGENAHCELVELTKNAGP